MVEDERSITEPLSEALAREGFDTQVAGRPPRRSSWRARIEPDLVLLDVMLPDGSGYDVCRELRAGSRVPIIMLTARGEETDRIVGLELGADDYIVKPFSAREVVARIRAVLRRAGDQARRGRTEPIEIGPLRLDRAARAARPSTASELDLTRKEFELLELLMSEAGSVITRERLIDEVWDVNWFGSTKTLDVHVSGLRRKLGDSSGSPRFIHTVRGVGFRFAGPGGARARVSLRARLLAAFAYVLVLVIVALLVPLALNLSRRVDAEIRSEAQGQAQLLAAFASGRLDDRERARAAGGAVGARTSAGA